MHYGWEVFINTNLRKRIQLKTFKTCAKVGIKLFSIFQLETLQMVISLCMDLYFSITIQLLNGIGLSLFYQSNGTCIRIRTTNLFDISLRKLCDQKWSILVDFRWNLKYGKKNTQWLDITFFGTFLFIQYNCQFLQILQNTWFQWMFNSFCSFYFGSISFVFSLLVIIEKKSYKILDCNQ